MSFANTTSHFKLEKKSLPEGIDSYGYSTFVTGKYQYLDYHSTLIRKGAEFSETSWRVIADLTSDGNGSLVERVAGMEAYRRVSEREIAEANLKLMPGFKFSWYYSGMDSNLDPLIDSPFKNTNKTKNFIREVF